MKKCIEFIKIFLFPKYKKLKQFIDKYSDEKSCYAYLEKNLPPDNVISNGVLFGNLNEPLTKCFHAIYIMTEYKRNIHYKKLAKLISVSEKHGWFMHVRITELLAIESELEFDV